MKEPVDVIQAKGRSHRSKEEMALRKAQEVHLDVAEMRVPDYLEGDTAMEFKRVVHMLRRFNEQAGVMVYCDLDVDAIAEYAIEHMLYLRVVDALAKAEDVDDMVTLHKMSSKHLDNCTKLASKLCLVVGDRYRLTVAGREEEADGAYLDI